MGLERLKEALEANDWEAPTELGDALNPEDFDEEEETDSIGFGLDAADRAEMEMEMLGMKQAIHGGGSNGKDEDEDEDGHDEGIEELQAMMLKMQAVRGEWCFQVF
jgi:hypothetical protein